MDAKTGAIFQANAEIMKALEKYVDENGDQRFVEIPEEAVDVVQQMNRHERRKWAAEMRKAKK